VVGYTLYSGITSGAQATKDDTDTALQFVTDTIKLKSEEQGQKPATP
jgi:hypothetical protein